MAVAARYGAIGWLGHVSTALGAAVGKKLDFRAFFAATTWTANSLTGATATGDVVLNLLSHGSSFHKGYVVPRKDQFEYMLAFFVLFVNILKHPTFCGVF